MSTERKSAFYLLAELSRRCSQRDCEQMERVFRDFIKECRLDPQALETLWISVIAGSNAVNVSLPLTSVCDLSMADFFSNRQSSEAVIAPLLRSAKQQIEQEIAPRSTGSKWDFRPLVVLWLLGAPSDEAQTLQVIHEIKCLPTKPCVLLITESDALFSEPFIGSLLDGPIHTPRIDGALLYKTWSYYGPCGVFWEDIAF